MKKPIKLIKPIVLEGEPCSHPGCLNHRTHPCEGCGRIGGRRYPTLGAQIKTLADLWAASEAKRAVFCPGSSNWSGQRPAAFFLNLQARAIFNLINSGLYIYNKPPRVYRPWNVAKKKAKKEVVW